MTRIEKRRTRVRLYCGDCLEVLPTLEPGSVQCCVSSPPYWCLRDYGTAVWEGGDEMCDHKNETRHQSQGTNSARAGRSNVEEQRNENFKSVCHKCGARRIDQQIGLEETPEQYVAKLVEVFREVRRVLRDDGTLWLNLGDSYTGSSNSGGKGKQDTACRLAGMPKKVCDGLKPKDLVGMPWRVAFALQADGWYLRQDIIWHKPNPMPESVTDRCTKSHEYLFLLAKSQKYHCDMAAIKEPAAYAGQMRGGSTKRYEQNAAGMDCKVYDTRNRRDVWTIPTEPYLEAHFATFPTALVVPCIMAGCPAGGLVLDPFMGSGTVGEVAMKHGCRFVGIELNPEYLELAKRRLANATPCLFAAAEVTG